MVNVLLYSTGCLATMHLPSWLHWLNINHPNINYKVVLSYSAQRFFGHSSLRAFSRGDVVVDSWELISGSPHIEFSDWSDLFFVHPASVHFMTSFANFRSDTPTLLALQGTDKPVIIAASTPPKFTSTACWSWIQSNLSKRENVLLLPPTRGFSANDPSVEGCPPVFSMKLLIKH